MFNTDINEQMLTEEERLELDGLYQAADDFVFLKGLSKCFAPCLTSAGVGLTVGSYNDPDLYKLGLTCLGFGAVLLAGIFFSAKLYKIKSAKHSAYKQVLREKYGLSLIKTPSK